MTLLIITRKVDKKDSLAGFIYNWVKKIGENVDKLIVICQEEGDSSGLPKNIIINSLGKEKSYPKLKQFLIFQSLLSKNIKQVDGVFAHMMPIYSILAGPYCRLHSKKLIQWYTHRSVDWRLRLANLFVDEFITASRESFRLRTHKHIHIFGHGIDVEQFSPGNQAKTFNHTRTFNIITVGRISPTKDYESIIKAIYELVNQQITNIKLIIIGDIGLKKQAGYLANLKQMVIKMQLTDYVEFLGAISNAKILIYLRQADLFTNLSGTGSLDKAVLEAMASGCLVLTSNMAFKSFLPEELIVQRGRPYLLVEKIKYLMHLRPSAFQKLTYNLRQTIIELHNIDNLARNIVNLYK